MQPIDPNAFYYATIKALMQGDIISHELDNAARALPGRGAMELPQGMLMRLGRHKADLNAALQSMGALAMAPVRPRAMHPGERVLSFSDEAREVIRSLYVLEESLTYLRDALRKPPSDVRDVAIGAILKRVAIADASFEQAWAGLESAVAPF